MPEHDLGKDVEKLSQKVRLLSEENELLTERAEDMHLLGIISEQMTGETSVSRVISLVLESVSTLKDLYYAAFLSIEGDTMTVSHEFGPSLPGTRKGNKYTLGKDLRGRLADREYVFDLSPGSSVPDFIPAEQKAPLPDSFYLRPVPARGPMAACILFASTVGDRGHLVSLSLLLDRISDVLGARMEALSLMSEVREINRTLEIKVAERTALLEESYGRTLKENRQRRQSEASLQQRIRELAALNRLSQTVGAHLSADKMIQASLEGVSDILHPDLALFFVKDGEALSLKGSHKNSPAIPFRMTEKHHVGECICGLAVKDDRPVYSRDLGSDPRCTLPECKNAKMKSFAALPLRSANTVMGVLCLASQEAVPFDEQAPFLETLAAEVALGLQNCQLFEEVKQHSEELDRINAALNHEMSERKKAEETLLHSQKIEAIGQLAGGVAHEFNNILTAIINNVYLLRIRVGQDKSLVDIVEKISSLSNNAASVTKKLLTFSRKQHTEFTAVNLKDIVQGMKNMLSNLIRADIDFSIKTAGQDLVVTADRNQIEQVIVNLVTNARDAIQGSGRITIESGLAEQDAPVPDEYSEQGHYAFLAVTDTGCGMDKETQERVFEPFFTTKDIGKGTGLGLAIVYGIVKEHKGRLVLTSGQGKGTSVAVYLPLAGTSVEQNKAAAEHHHLRGSGETVLIAEDDPAVRSSMRTVLEEFNYRVIEAADGKKAVDLFMEHSDDIQLLVLDVVMPGMDGQKTLQAIREVRPGIKALFVSGYGKEDLGRSSGTGQGITIISKPVLPEVLVKTVKDVLKNP